jgi:hypothetical protein
MLKLKKMHSCIADTTYLKFMQLVAESSLELFAVGGYYISLKLRWTILSKKVSVTCIYCVMFHSSFHDYNLNFIFTLIVTVIVNTVQWHILNYHNEKSCWFHLTILCLVIPLQRECVLGLYFLARNLEHIPLLPISKPCLLNWFRKPWCSGWGMLLPNCPMCFSFIVYVLLCHCMVHVKKVCRFCVQVRVVMCTFAIWEKGAGLCRC